MNNQVVLIGLISLSCISIFFIYQNIKLKRMYTEEFTRINKNMDDVTRLVSLNAEKNNLQAPNMGMRITPMGQVPNVPVVVPEQNVEDDSKYTKLKNNYEEYVKTNFEPYEFESIPEELKEGIENLTQEGFVESSEVVRDLNEEVIENQDLSVPENSDDIEEVDPTSEMASVSEEAHVEHMYEEREPVIQLETLDNVEQNESVVDGVVNELNELVETNEPVSQVETSEFVNNVVNELSASEDPVSSEFDNFVAEQNLQSVNVSEQTFSVNDNNEISFEDEEEVDVDVDAEDNVVEGVLSENHTVNVQLENFGKSSSENLENMTLKELQQLARDNNVKVKGKKTDLIDRLKEKLC